MAVSGAVKLEVIAQAQENINAVLRKSNAAIRKTSDELRRAEGAQGKLGKTVDTVKGKVTAFKGAILAMGSAAAAAALQQLATFTKEGAAMADQVDAVRGRVSNLDEVIKETQEATTGIVDEAAIVKGAALFDAFGLEIAQLPALFAEASKTSLRTGESIDFLISSAVTGVSRLSPQILDNLGLQVRLSDATKEAAEKFKIQANAVDDTQKKAGMLSLVLKRLGEQNKDIRLNDSRVASMQRLEVQFKNTTDAVKQSFADLFRSSGDRMEEFAKRTDNAVRKAANKWSDLTSTVEAEVKRQSLTLQKAEGDQLRAASMQTLAIEQATALEKAGADQKARIRSAEGAALKEAIDARTVLEQTANGLRIFDEKAWEAIQERHRSNAAARNKEEMREIAARFEARRDELIAADAVTEVRIEQEREAIALMGGATRAQLRLTEAKREFEIAAREGTEQAILAASAEVKAAQAAKDAEDGKARARKATARVIKESKDDLEAMLATQLFENKLAMAGTDLAKARLIATQKEKELAVEMAQIGEHALANEYERARQAAIDLELDEAKNAAKDEEVTTSGNALEIARLSIEIAREKNALRLIDLETDREILAIKDQDLSLAEQSLAIDLAKTEAERERGELAQLNREQLAETLGEGFGGAFAEGASLLQEMDATLDELNRPKRFENVVKGFNTLSKAVPEASKKFAELGESSLDSGEKVAGGIAAGLGMIGPSVAAFVDGTVEKAAIMGAFEAAMAIATAFTNPAEAASHGVAAAMFFAMAGVAASQPKSAVPDAETAGAGGLITPAAEAPEERAAGSFTINLGPGTIFGLPQEMGAQIAERINSMSGSGFEESTAF